MDFYGITSVAAITVICALAAQAVKATPMDNKWLPVICGVLGGVLGVVSAYVIPDFPASDPITAVAVGIVSGLAATGAHQAVKQLSGKTDSDNETEDDANNETEDR
ncbi:MAG: phage holin family protein [Candidatus Woodwardiibium sp.]